MKKTVLLISFAAILAAFSLKADAKKPGLHTVVIDAGHGGKDPGAVSSDKKTYEKTFALDIALNLADRIKKEYPDVNVILTREDDRFVELNRRAEIANKADADLFISLHINAAGNKTANGYSVHVLGQSSKKNRDLFAANMEICKRENSVVTLYEDDYSTNYAGFDPADPESFIFMQMMQNSHLEQSIQFAQIISQKLKASPLRTNGGISQNPFLVLWKTAMPAVLVEMGYISNSDDLWTLRQTPNREKIADCLFDAFKSYKLQYDSSVNIKRSAAAVEQAPKEAAAPAVVEKTVAEPEKKTVEAKAENVTDAKPAETSKANTVKPAENKPVAKPSEQSTPATTKPVQNVTTAAPEAATSVRYGVQAFAVSKAVPNGDPRLLGFAPIVVQSGSINKYIIGVSPSLDEAKSNFAKIRAKYPDSFMVRIDASGAVTRLK